MPTPATIKKAAEAAKNATATEGQRDALKDCLHDAYKSLRYEADELLLRRLLTCCAALEIYAPRDVAHLKKWIDLVLEKI